MSQSPIVKPLLALLHSRKFIMFVISTGLSFVVSQVPELAPHYSQLAVFIGVVALAVIGGITYEDVAKLRSELPKEFDLDATLDELADLVLEKLGGSPDDSNSEGEVSGS